MIDKDLITDIKNSVNIVDIIGEVINLTKSGRNFLGLCPFHGEKTPSFNVVEDKQFYHCFGCGKSGDVFKFIEEYQGVSFIESVATIAERTGIALNQDVMQPKAKVVSPHQSLYDVHQAAADLYHTILMTTKLGEKARAYLHDRGLSDDIIKHFHLGLAPKEENYLYQTLSQTFDEQTLLNSALFNPSENQMVYDAFQNRITFPLTDEYGRVIAFSGRIWTEEDEGAQLAKYKNSRASLIFNKSYELYHLDQAKASIKKQHEVYLMEGFMDVIAAYRSGISNAVASMGTALTPEHVQHLSQFTKKLVIVYDGDKAGQAASAKALDNLKGFSVELVRLPDQMDPDEFLQKNSEEDLKKFLTSHRISQVEFLIQYLKPENIENLQAQIAFVDEIAKIIAQTPSITAQDTYAHKVADILPDFTYEQVESAINQVRTNGRKQSPAPPPLMPPLNDREFSRAKQLPTLLRVENHLFNRMVNHPFVLNDYRLREAFSFQTPELQILFQFLKKEGSIDPYDLAQLDERVQQAWYLAMGEDLPEEIGVNELAEIELSREREILRRENRRISQKIREQSHTGDEATVLADVERLIAQKRKME